MLLPTTKVSKVSCPRPHSRVSPLAVSTDLMTRSPAFFFVAPAIFSSPSFLSCSSFMRRSHSPFPVCFPVVHTQYKVAQRTSQPTSWRRGSFQSSPPWSRVPCTRAGCSRRATASWPRWAWGAGRTASSCSTTWRSGRSSCSCTTSRRITSSAPSRRAPSRLRGAASPRRPSLPRGSSSSW